MANTVLRYIETTAIVVVVAAAVHYIANVDWPWAIAAGAAASVLVRAILHRRPAARP